MPQQAKRKNEQLLSWLRAAAIAGVTWFALSGMHVNPGWLPIALAAGAGALTLLSAELGILGAVVALSIPIVAAQPVLGLAALVLGVVAVRYLGADGGRAFLVVAVAAVGAFLGPVWAGAAIGGFMLGASEGALAAAVACVVVESIGVVLGKAVIGATITGGPATALVSFAKMPDTLLSVEWLRHAFSAMGAQSVNNVVAGVSAITQPAALIAQPVVWAAGAVVAGLIGARVRKTGGGLVLKLAAAGSGVVVVAAGEVGVWSVLGVPIPTGTFAVAAVSSLVATLVFVAVMDTFFAFEPVARTRAAAQAPSGMASEDADVDELLRLIATAEDQLQSRHTTNKVVMITDMKSFSRMTEEDGSVVTAKAIQRHRDLLLPIISRHGGCGKSTGGDGLVAAFESAAEAVRASAEMQSTLAENNAAHPNEREIWVRMGLASGEVVLDKGGRPFIGAALNLAARVMNLADGGQVFVTKDVAAAAPSVGVRSFSFGEFELKNIAKPVEIMELLWADGQEPRDPRGPGESAG